MRASLRAAGVALASIVVGATAVPVPAAAAEGSPGGYHRGGGYGIDSLGLRINGRFDLAYERRGYTNDPTEGEDAFENYHRFIFISRQSKDDPYFFTAEIIDQTFYEIGARITDDDAPVRFSLKAGKILVPFGPDPLFHNSYGGLAGFDQPILPVVWARYGATSNLKTDLGADFRLSNDLYVVNGYELQAADDILNLQNGFAPDGEAQVAIGDRVSLSWGPVGLWYSLYYQDIGFGQRLLLQAVDVSLWRMPDVPVLEDIVISAGFLRADVTGGSEPDYYHFGDYLQVRYYPTDWLYLQYRTGIATFDNRDGFYFDDDRATSDDSKTHNIGLVYLDGPFSAGLYHFWNLEEDVELDNDFLRFLVTLSF